MIPRVKVSNNIITRQTRNKKSKTRQWVRKTGSLIVMTILIKNSFNSVMNELVRYNSDTKGEINQTCKNLSRDIDAIF